MATEFTLSVVGMDCSSCAEGVDKALRAVDGVQDVRVDVVGGKVNVRFAEDRVARADLLAEIRRLGYHVNDARPPTVAAFEVEGLCCASEARQIEARLGHLPGVSRLSFDAVNHKLMVEGHIASAEVERAVADLGMKARLIGEERKKKPWWERRGKLLLTIIAGILWAGSLTTEYLLNLDRWSAVLALGTVLIAGRYVFPRGYRAAMNRALDMNFLMSVATLGAILIGEWEEAASVMFLFTVAQLLESYSMDRARNAIKALMNLSPAEATVLRDGREVRVSVDKVKVGELVVIRPGEKVGVDGTVVSGVSSVNQAPITGESIPVEKEPGSEVFAGTLNGQGALEVRSTKPAADTTLARIIHSVEEAQASRAPSQTFVDRFARVYTPLVVGSAVVLAVLPPLLGSGSWSEWFYRALVLLVVACPCALVISTPVTVVSALAGAARRGILIKGGLHLENAGRARAIAIDKTGTLTHGVPDVVDVVALNGADPSTVLSLAASVEMRSEHALAGAIVRHAEAEGIEFGSVAETSAATGRGVRAQVEGQIVYVGSARLFDETGGVEAEVRRRLDRFEAQGRTAVLVGATVVGGNGRPHIHGIISIADRIRPNAAEALRELHQAGIRHIVMLTGDNAGTAQAISDALGGSGGGLDDFRAGLLPEDKVAAVQELQRRYGMVLMVGDGVNDAPALAAADVGIAMGSAGTDVALETADIALMADDLSKLATTIRIARKAERIIRANIAFSLLTKAAFVVLAVMGYATLWMAVFADMGASLLVVMNGLRALRI
jgi:Cd2+/Zn2+-exporting ATPase